MGYFFTIGLIAILAIVAHFVVGSMHKENPTFAPSPTFVLPVGLLLIGIITLFNSVNTINAGHVGIVYQFGAIVGETSDGLVMLPPWQSVREANVQQQKAIFKNPNNDDEKKSFLGRIDAGSKETQNVYMDVTVNWYPDRGKVRDLYRNTGPKYFATLVTSRVQELFKNEVVKYEAVAITQQRAAIGDAVREALNKELNEYGLTIASIQIDNLWYSGEFDAAIERKQVATQDALREQENVKSNEAKAKQAEATAKGEALANAARADGERQAAIFRATGEAESIRLRAIAQAEANIKVAQSLTPDLVRTQSIQKWDGKFPPVIPSGSVPFIDPMRLFGQ